jgi:hypothetical protein
MDMGVEIETGVGMGIETGTVLEREAKMGMGVEM